MKSLDLIMYCYDGFTQEQKRVGLEPMTLSTLENQFIKGYCNTPTNQYFSMYDAFHGLHNAKEKIKELEERNQKLSAPLTWKERIKGRREIDTK